MGLNLAWVTETQKEGRRDKGTVTGMCWPFLVRWETLLGTHYQTSLKNDLCFVTGKTQQHLTKVLSLPGIPPQMVVNRSPARRKI